MENNPSLATINTCGGTDPHQTQSSDIRKTCCTATKDGRNKQSDWLHSRLRHRIALSGRRRVLLPAVTMGDLAPHRLALPLISNELGLLLAEMGLITRLIVVAGGVRDSSINQVHVRE